MKEKDNFTYDCIIIGAGISGISFAQQLCRSGQRVLMLEKNDKAGGRISTIVPDKDSSHIVEAGAHTCYNSYTQLLSLYDDVENSGIIQPLNKTGYMLYDKGKIKSIFSGINFFSLLPNGWRMFSASKEGKTVREYYRPLVGKKNYDNLFRYFFQAVILQIPDEYPSEKFLKKRNSRVEELPRRYSFKGGLSTAINEIIRKNELEIIYSSEVSAIDHSSSVWTIETADKKSYQSKNLVLACDSQTAAELLADTEKDISRLLSGISMFLSDALTVTVKKEALALKPISGLLSTDPEFMSAISSDPISSGELRSMTFHFQKGKSDKERIATACKVLNISESDIIEHHTTPHILPQIRLEHNGMAEKISDLRVNPSLFITGNYFDGLSLEDCVRRSFHEFERYKSVINLR